MIPHWSEALVQHTVELESRQSNCRLQSDITFQNRPNLISLYIRKILFTLCTLLESTSLRNAYVESSMMQWNGVYTELCQSKMTLAPKTNEQNCLLY